MISNGHESKQSTFYPAQGNADGTKLIRLLARLVRDAGRKGFPILVNLSVRHAKAVRAWQKNGSYENFFLLAYSPALNSDEHLNCDLKARYLAENQRQIVMN